MLADRELASAVHELGTVEHDVAIGGQLVLVRGRDLSELPLRILGYGLELVIVIARSNEGRTSLEISSGGMSETNFDVTGHNSALVRATKLSFGANRSAR